MVRAPTFISILDRDHLLDGNTIPRNSVDGPLIGRRTCSEIVGGFVPTAFVESIHELVEGYFTGCQDNIEICGLCVYPCKLLQEGVGLLFVGQSEINLTSALSQMVRRKVKSHE